MDARDCVEEKTSSEHFGEESLFCPKDDASIDEKSYDLFATAIQSSKATNVAITGPYGSGKSTFVRSFEKRYGEACSADVGACKSFAYVSLAGFDFSQGDQTSAKGEQSIEQKGTQDNAPVMQDDTSVLEKKIIDQLAARPFAGKCFIGKVKWDSEIYPSKRVRDNRNIFIGALLVFCAAIVILFAVSGLLSSFQVQIPDWFKTAIAGGIIIVFVLMAIWYFVSGCPPLFRAVSTPSISFDFGQDEIKEETFFDRNIAYILRLFESRKENVYVFEDLDRRNTETIFSHLRELNMVLNNYFGDERRITFVYCIRDDLLQGESRTKFFDVIIPVVPFVNGYNSYGQLRECLGRYSQEINEHLLRNVSLYVHGNRDIQDIANEYSIYLEALKGENEDAISKDKMLALICVKVLAPRLFALLEQKRGGLYAYLNGTAGQTELDESGKRVFSLARLTEIVQEDLNEGGQVSSVNELIGFLVTTRYLTEDYYLYIARPDDKGLSRNDRKWLMAARSGVKNYEAPIDSPESLQHYLNSFDFKNLDMLNVQYVAWMIRHGGFESYLSDVVNSLIVHKDSQFANLIIDACPEFARIAFDNRESFYSDMDGEVSTINYSIATVVAFASDGERLIQINQANGVFIENGLEKAGAYATSVLEKFGDVGAVRQAIAEVMELFEVYAVTLDENADKPLLRILSMRGLCVLSKKNCQVLCDCFGGENPSSTDLIDRMRGLEPELVWNVILADSDAFVDEYCQEDVTIDCSEEGILELLNSGMSVQKQKIMLSHFSGTISSLQDISNKSAWDCALDKNNVEVSLDNALLFLGVHGCTTAWVNYANRLTSKSFDECSVDEKCAQKIVDSALHCEGLNIEVYDGFAFLAASKERREINLPTNLRKEQLQSLFDNNILILNNVTLEKARSILAEDDLLTYLLRNIGDYIVTLKNYGMEIAKETVLILSSINSENIEDFEGVTRDLITLLSSPIADISKMDNGVVVELICQSKITTEALFSAMQRYGKEKRLDAVLLDTVHSMPSGDIATSSMPSQLIRDSYLGCSIDRKAALVLVAATTDCGLLKEVLLEHGGDGIRGILRHRHPARQELDGEELAIVDSLVKVGLVSIGANGRVYLRASKWSADRYGE